MPDSLPAKVLAEKGIPSVPIALSYPWGKGEIILVSTPLLFTNYGVLDGKKCYLHFPPIIPNGRFTHCPHRRLHEANGPNTDVPFPVFPFSKTAEMGFVFDDVHHYPLHGIHRPKEATGNSIIYQPENKSLEFTELIGTLYFQKKDHADLVHKKYIYFAEELRREIQVNIEEVANDEHSFSRIAQKDRYEYRRDQ